MGTDHRRVCAPVQGHGRSYAATATYHNHSGNIYIGGYACERCAAGRDDPLAQHAAKEADTLVTPLNDSFVDFDLIGQVDAESFKVRRLSFYAEAIWEARLARSKTTIEQNRPQMDWVVVRNRTGHTEARNMVRIERALTELSKRVGFRVSSGLSERVIYRELFPSGLTLLDKGHLGDLGTSHLVARQELRQLVQNLNLPVPEGADRALEAA